MHSSLQFSVFFRRSYFFITTSFSHPRFDTLDEASNKSPSPSDLRARSYIGYQIFGHIINSVGKIANFGHKKGKGFGKRAAHPYPVFLGVPPLGHFTSEDTDPLFIVVFKYKQSVFLCNKNIFLNCCTRHNFMLLCNTLYSSKQFYAKRICGTEHQ